MGPRGPPGPAGKPGDDVSRPKKPQTQREDVLGLGVERRPEEPG
jgi:hypothetical protein